MWRQRGPERLNNLPRSPSKWQNLEYNPDLICAGSFSSVTLPTTHPDFLSPFIFFVTLHLHTLACFHLIFLLSYGCALSLCLWVGTESKLRPHRTSTSIFQGVMELVLPEGCAFRNFWHRPARAFSRFPEKPSKVSWGSIGQTNTRDDFYAFVPTLPEI